VGNTTYTYNANGSRVSKTLSGSTTSYSYDYDEQLTQVASPVTGTSSFTYDGLGRRVSQTAGGVTTTFHFSGNRITTEVQGANVVAHYVYGVNRVSRDASGSYEYYHNDGLGSTRQISNDSQSVTQTTTYDAFGNVESSAGSSNNVYKYAGQWGYRNDGDDGLMHVGARYYDPLVGRFITVDPIRSGLNWYAYTDNDPVNKVDPTGHQGIFLSSSAIFSRPNFIRIPTPRPNWQEVVRPIEYPSKKILGPESGQTATPEGLADQLKTPGGRASDWVRRVTGVDKWDDPTHHLSIPGGPPPGFGDGDSNGGDDPLHPPPIIA
jgi:RHS repeat-associated protein